MQKNRLEAFSDGVFAILITIMVLELHPPKECSFQALQPLIPVFASYVFSFIFLGIYWNNHHHMVHGSKSINSSSLWANHHLLFWISLIPFCTSWVGQSQFQPLPVAIYSFTQLMGGVAYYILTQCLIAANGKDSAFAQALGRDIKGKLSVIAYVIATPLALISPFATIAIMVVVMFLWIVPDRRFQRHVEHQ